MKPWLTIMSVLTSVFCGFMLHIKLTEPSLTIDIPIIDIKPLLDPDCTPPSLSLSLSLCVCVCLKNTSNSP